jgi:nucleoid-associated protein YgaU
MGTFEKLGILVIVVIIVMILAVAIYQWGGAEPATQTPDLPYPLTIRTLGELEGLDEDGVGPAAPGGDAAPDAATWPGGIPRTHVIKRNDKVWVLVVKRWKLKVSFIAAITAANPTADMKRLRPGQKLTIPDPSPYVRKAGAGRAPTAPRATTRYEIQIGDNLESIAYRHLGARKRWREIEALNPGLNRMRLKVGQEIYLPLK